MKKQLAQLISAFLLVISAAFAQTTIPANYFDRDAVRARVIADVQRWVDWSNNHALALFVSRAQSWEINAKIAQDNNLPMPPKPTPPMGLKLVPRETDDPNTLPVEVVVSTTPLAPPVPDLPEVKKPTGIVVSIGVRLYGAYYQAKADDTAPAGHETTLDGARYRKVMSPWGGWWLRLDN